MYFPGQYKLEPTPEPSDEEEDSSEEEEEAFGGGKKKKEEEDPAASEILFHFLSELYSSLTIKIYEFQRPRRWQRKPRKKLWKWLRANVSYNSN